MYSFTLYNLSIHAATGDCILYIHGDILNRPGPNTWPVRRHARDIIAYTRICTATDSTSSSYIHDRTLNSSVSISYKYYYRGCLLFRVCCVVCMWNGGLDLSLLLVSGRSVVLVRACRSPNSRALLCLGAAFGGLALRASENYKLQITNYSHPHPTLNALAVPSCALAIAQACQAKRMRRAPRAPKTAHLCLWLSCGIRCTTPSG